MVSVFDMVQDVLLEAPHLLFTLTKMLTQIIPAETEEQVVDLLEIYPEWKYHPAVGIYKDEQGAWVEEFKRKRLIHLREQKSQVFVWKG